jgi:hypothetical protein
MADKTNYRERLIPLADEVELQQSFTDYEPLGGNMEDIYEGDGGGSGSMKEPLLRREERDEVNYE